MQTTLFLNENTPILQGMYLLGAGTAGIFLTLLGGATWAAFPRWLRLTSSAGLWGFYLLALWVWRDFLLLYPGLWVMVVIGIGLCGYASYRAVTVRRPVS